jgi:hypothetical protein
MGGERGEQGMLSGLVELFEAERMFTFFSGVLCVNTFQYASWKLTRHSIRDVSDWGLKFSCQGITVNRA